MINVSTEFKNALLDGNRKFNKYVDITLKDGTLLELDSSQIWDGGFKFSGGSTESGNFTIGTVIIGKFVLLLNNVNDEFTGYDFDGAIVRPYIGLQLSEREEIVRKGTYIVDEPIDNATIITLECLDYMSKFDKPFELNLTYPIRIRDIVLELCSDSGVTLINSDFDGGEIYITEPLSTDNRTNREVLAYCMQYVCKFAYLDGYGRLSIIFYNKEFNIETNYDGGVFDDSTPYASGDDLDGGSLNPWTEGDSADGGNFGDRDNYHHFFAFKGLSHATEDIQITGIQVTEEFDETETSKRQTVLFGEQGYVISIASNPLISKGKADSVASFIGSRLVGMRFRPMNFNMIGDPTVEQGDSMIVTDRKGVQYRGYVTNYTYTIGSMQSISCDAETVREKNATTVNPITKIIQEVRQDTKQQISEYDKSVQQLTELITNSFGSFKTEEIQEDGSVIYYMHDKPLLSDSMTIWKKTIDAFAVSTDGGETWNAGMDSEGHALVNVLSAVGINADWINAGSISGVEINIANKFIVNSVGETKFQGNSFEVSSTNFNLTKTGNLTAKNATLDIVTANNATISGKVTSSSGAIGGWTLASNGLKSTDGKTLEHSGLTNIYTWADLGTIQLYITGVLVLPDQVMLHYDFNGDGRVTAADYAILRDRLIALG